MADLLKNWQALEEEFDNAVIHQYVWSPVYVDAFVARLDYAEYSWSRSVFAAGGHDLLGVVASVARGADVGIPSPQWSGRFRAGLMPSVGAAAGGLLCPAATSGYRGLSPG